MRFDDSLKTVLAAGGSSDFGAQASWRQIVDLAGRGRVAIDDALLAYLSGLRATVPLPVRAASARALALARPEAALVGFFAEDAPLVAAPVLRTAWLPAEDWLTLLPRLRPAGRSVLRSRRDLPAQVVRGLEQFGSVDFTLSYDAPEAVEPPEAPGAVGHADAEEFAAAAHPPAAAYAPGVEIAPPEAPRSPTPFVRLGDVASRLPLVAEARRRTEEPSRFEIADIVARIDAFRREQTPPATAPAPATIDQFDIHTDAQGVIRWTDAASRATLVGASLARAGAQGLVHVDAGIAGAAVRRSRIEDGRIEIVGEGELAGSWRLTAAPRFDHATGRFSGYAGRATRAARHQRAERGAATDGLRELVHELRTPVNAVAGFAEFIEAQLLGPVPDVYRQRAGDIRRHSADLLAAIDDLDTAARIDAAALDLHPGEVALATLLEEVETSLRPLSDARGATLAIRADDAVAAVDERAAERLVARLLAALLAMAAPGETLAVIAEVERREVILSIDRPAALAGRSADDLLALAGADEVDGVPLLGVGFTLRLVGNLAREVGGALELGGHRLTLRLPTVLPRRVEQAATN